MNYDEALSMRNRVSALIRNEPVFCVVDGLLLHGKIEQAEGEVIPMVEVVQMSLDRLSADTADSADDWKPSDIHSVPVFTRWFSSFSEVVEVVAKGGPYTV